MRLESFIDFCDYFQEITPIMEMYHPEELPEELNQIIATEASNSKNVYPVYIVLIRTSTIVAKIITTATRTRYSHCSISFDSKMKNMYSFGRYMDDDGNVSDDPKDARFTKEQLQNPVLLGNDLPYCIYVTFVTKEELNRMKKKLQFFIDNQSKFKFNNIGLIQNFFHIKTEWKDKLFCSQFVSEILNSGISDFTQKHASLMKPSDFQYEENCYFLCEGIIDDYDYREVDRLTKNLKKLYMEGKLTDDD